MLTSTYGRARGGAAGFGDGHANQTMPATATTAPAPIAAQAR